MSTEFASAGLTAGQLNAIVKKLGGPEGALRFLGHETMVAEPTCSCYEQNGIIYLRVTSNGMAGEQGIAHFEGRGFCIDDCAKSVLRSPDFKPTKGVTTQIAILKGALFRDNDRITKKIRAFADKCNCTAPNAEVAYLIRDVLTDEKIEAMGLSWIAAMHEPIEDSYSRPRLLSVHRDHGGRGLRTICDGPGYGWVRDGGFAFAVSPSFKA